MTHRIQRTPLLFLLLSLFLFSNKLVGAQEQPAVRAVLFYSPTCPHCHEVINELLVPMVDEYGDRLQILAIDITQLGGRALYQSAIDHFQIPEERLGVPTLVVGDVVLVGSGEIPAQFPTIVDDGLVAGIDWPAVPGLVPPAGPGATEPQPTATQTLVATTTAAPLATVAPTSTAEQPVALAPAESPPPPGDQPSFVLDSEQPAIVPATVDDPPADPVGFALATAILVVMVLAIAYVAWRLAAIIRAGRQAADASGTPALSWVIPFIAVLGIGVASYLAYVEMNQVEAVCGPVGHCNLVQSSSYARILGIPVALLGIVTYLSVIGLWFAHYLARRRANDWLANWTVTGLVGLSIFGTLFSVYLTLLELFVIRAVCAWCLTSAVLMTLLMLLVVRPLGVKSQLALHR